jgi:Ca2+-binding EF-hand superfamily protein
MLDYAIISLQRLLANRHALKNKYKSFDQQSQSSGGSARKKKKKRKKKKDEGGGEDDDDEDDDADAEDETEADGEETKTSKNTSIVKQDSFKKLKKQMMKKGPTDRDAYLKAKKRMANKLRKEWSDEGEKAKGFSRILLKFGTRDSGLAKSIAAVYAAHEAVSFQPLELQVPRILNKIRAVEPDAGKVELIMRMYELSPSVPRLLQSQLLRSMLMDAVVRLEANPKAGELTFSKTQNDGSLIDIRKLDNRRRKAIAKNAALIDPGDLLAACITVDECFRLFDDDDSGEIDVEEMEQMQTLIGDFGEDLIKELYRITTLKTADEEGSVEGLTLEEFMGVFCSTMGITTSDQEDGDEDDENDHLDQDLVFDTVDVAGYGFEDDDTSDRGQGDWMSLAVDLDEASTLAPIATNEMPPHLAVQSSRRDSIGSIGHAAMPHSAMCSPVHPRLGVVNASTLKGGAEGGLMSAAKMSVAIQSKRRDSIGSIGSRREGDLSVRSGTALAYLGSTAGGSVGGGKQDDQNDGREELGKKHKAKLTLWSLQDWKEKAYVWATYTKACFGYGTDKKLEAVNNEFMERIKDAFSVVSKEKIVTENSNVDIKHLGKLMQSITGGREIPKPELEIMVQRFDPEGSKTVSHESFAAGLMLLKDDPSLNRLLGQDLSRLLDHRSMHKAGGGGAGVAAVPSRVSVPGTRIRMHNVPLLRKRRVLNGRMQAPGVKGLRFRV